MLIALPDAEDSSCIRDASAAAKIRRLVAGSAPEFPAVPQRARVQC